MDLGSSLCSQRNMFNLGLLNKNSYSFPHPEEFSEKFVKLDPFTMNVEGSVKQLNHKQSDFLGLSLYKLGLQVNMQMSMMHPPKFGRVIQPMDCLKIIQPMDCFKIPTDACLIRKPKLCIISGFIGTKCQNYRSEVGNTVGSTMHKDRIKTLSLQHQNSGNPKMFKSPNFNCKKNSLVMTAAEKPYSPTKTPTNRMDIQTGTTQQSEITNSEISLPELPEVATTEHKEHLELKQGENIDLSGVTNTDQEGMTEKSSSNKPPKSIGLRCDDAGKPKAAHENLAEKRRNKNKRRAERKKMKALVSKETSVMEGKMGGNNKAGKTIKQISKLVRESNNPILHTADGNSVVTADNVPINGCVNNIQGLEQNVPRPDLHTTRTVGKSSSDPLDNIINIIPHVESTSQSKLSSECANDFKNDDEIKADSSDIVSISLNVTSQSISHDNQPELQSICESTSADELQRQDESKDKLEPSSAGYVCPVSKLVKTCSNSLISFIMGLDEDQDDDEECSDWSEEETDGECQSMWEEIKNEFCWELPRQCVQSTPSQQQPVVAKPTDEQPALTTAQLGEDRIDGSVVDQDCVDNRVVPPNGVNTPQDYVIPPLLNCTVPLRTTTKQDCLIPSIGLKYHNKTTEGLQRINDRWTKYIKDCPPKSDSPVSTKRVRFSEVNPQVCWVAVEDRRGQWEEFARDSERFQCKVKSIGAVLAPILHPIHRESVWKKRFCDSSA